jgi:predicted enzyme related to lactoylglutathione lyase
MSDNPVGWFEIYVQDMGRAKAFYESVFGGQLAKLDSPDRHMGLPDARRAPWRPRSPGSDAWLSC